MTTAHNIDMVESVLYALPDGRGIIKVPPLFERLPSPKSSLRLYVGDNCHIIGIEGARVPLIALELDPDCLKNITGALYLAEVIEDDIIRLREISY